MDLFDFLFELGEKYGIPKIEIMVLIRLLKCRQKIVQYCIIKDKLKELGVELDRNDEDRLAQFFPNVDIEKLKEEFLRKARKKRMEVK